MKKSLVILMVLVLVSGCGIYFANAAIGNEIDNVEFIEKVAYGDKSVVEGLSVVRKASYDTNMFWDTTYTFGESPVADTTFEFYEYGKETVGWQTVYAGLQFHATHTASTLLRTEYYKDGTNLEGIDRVLYELMENAPAGKITTKTVKLKDYLPYYTFSLYVDIQDFDYDYGSYDMSAGYSDEVVLKKKTTLEDFNSFFKIPILEEERYVVGVNKDASGNIIGYGYSSLYGGVAFNDYDYDTGVITGDAFEFDMSSVYSEDTIYFTFSPLTVEGKIVDTSLIPGGYGIYSCKYDRENKLIDASTLKLEYKLEPTGYVSLKLDAQKENLLVFTEDSEQFYVTVLDIDTLEEKQTFMYGTAEWNNIARYYRIEEDYVIAQCNYFEGVLLSRNEDGTYTKEFTFPAIVYECSEENYFLASDNAFAWNGNTLVIAGDLMVERPYYMSGCGIFIGAFDETGVLFYGEYDSSLNTGAIEGEYWICEPLYREGLVLEWN